MTGLVLSFAYLFLFRNNVTISCRFCPQFSALWDNITVEEHLTFFSQIKGRMKSHTQARIGCVYHAPCY